MKTVLAAFFIIISMSAKAQTVDNIFVNLYTDSLKKGTYNYINIDGLMSNGKYLPLDSTKVIFTCNRAKFSGNNLMLPADFREEKVLIKVALRDNEKMYKEFEMYIKKAEDPPLRSQAEIMAEMRSKSRKG